MIPTLTQITIPPPIHIQGIMNPECIWKERMLPMKMPSRIPTIPPSRQITMASIKQAGGHPLIIGSVVGSVKAIGALIVVVLFVKEIV